MNYTLPEMFLPARWVLPVTTGQCVIRYNVERERRILSNLRFNGLLPEQRTTPDEAS